ncbi:alpha/beta hydrolase [soil metagenome]
MKQLFLIVLYLSLPFSLFPQNNAIIDGNWDGYIELDGQNLAISLTFNTFMGETDGAINIPQQSSFDMPVYIPFKTADSLIFTFETGSGPAFFRAALSDRSPEKISGHFQQMDVKYPFTINKKVIEPADSFERHTEEDFIIETPSHVIAGSLVTPESYEDSTLVIFVSGSGTQTRNSPVAGFEIFKELSLQLADNGYFSFRYDDRGTGGSTGTTDATLPELAEDLNRVASYFTDGDQTNRFSSVVYLGHSQGGIVSIIAAEESSPQQLILLSTPAMPGDEVIEQQIRHISQVQNIPEDVVEENIEFQERVYEAARTGTGWDELEKDIADRLHEQINELPEAQRRTLGNMDQFIQAQVSRQLDGAKTQWFRSFIETDPRPVLAELQIPVLALFGENDTEVLPEENRGEFNRYQNNVTTVTISKANHLFQTSESGMPGEYGRLDQEFTDGFINEIIHFLNEGNGNDL